LNELNKLDPVLAPQSFKEDEFWQLLNGFQDVLSGIHKKKLVV